MIQEGGIGTRREDLENDEEQPADQREQPRTPHILQFRSHFPSPRSCSSPFPPLAAPPVWVASAARALAVVAAWLAAGESGYGKVVFVVVSRYKLLAGQPWHCPIGSRVSCGENVSAAFERVPDGEVDGLRVEVVLEDDESIMFIR